jgi:RNA polymerase sigma factor for flagellar operon FliA
VARPLQKRPSMNASLVATTASATAVRNRLIAEHVEIAQRIARKVARRCPAWMSQEDLVSAGMLGLAEAADRFDDSRGEPFLVYATKRIRGAVLDELRRGDIMPRRVRRMARKVEDARTSLERQLGKTPEDAAMATALGVTIQVYRNDLASLSEVKVSSLDDGEHATPAAPEGESPADNAERSQLMARIKAALVRLEQRDAMILGLLYGDELSSVEVGQVLNISTSRVCQLHSRALTRLREELAKP